MNDYELKIEMLSRFARPTLFDAVKQPEMLVAMILANLMSPSLWLFKAQVQSHIPVDPMPERSHVKLIMSAIKSYVDRHLFHASPKEIGEIWGLLDLDEERKRLGVDTIDYSIDLIVTDLRGRQRRGQLTEKQNIFPLIDNGTFPEYDYSTIDSIKAYRRILKRKKHKPIGVSCCADEAVLIASLACVLHGARLRDILIFGSPVHYTALVEHKQQLFWFNGKHECFDGGAWCAEVGGKSVIDSQEPFDARITFERLISPLGKYVKVHRGWSKIMKKKLVDFYLINNDKKH